MKKKPLIGIIICILLFLTSNLPSVDSLSMENNSKDPQLHGNKPRYDNETIIPDYIGDVSSIDYVTGETILITNSTDIEVNNLDLTQATVTQIGIQITLSLQVVGIIEDRGELIDPYGSPFNFNAVEYGFQLITSEDEYMISYCNQTGKLICGGMQINLTSSAFSVVDGNLSITFLLMSSDEVYENLSVSSTYIKADFSNITSGFIYLTDLAPNPSLEILQAYGPAVGFVGESIQFNASIVPLTGLLPYVYHWDFGDQGTSTELNPIHIYTNEGVYEYTFTVIDYAGATAHQSSYITIYGIPEWKKAFLIGRFQNLITEGDYIIIDAINLRMIPFKPIDYRHFVAGEKITFTKQYMGMIFSHYFLIGIFNVTIESTHPQTPFMACTTDSTLNRITVAAADDDIKWKDIAITLDKPGATYQVYYANGTSMCPVNNTVDAGIAEVMAGDYIQLSTYYGNVKVSLRYIPTNSLLGIWTINV